MCRIEAFLLTNYRLGDYICIKLFSKNKFKNVCANDNFTLSLQTKSFPKRKTFSIRQAKKFPKTENFLPLKGTQNKTKLKTTKQYNRIKQLQNRP